MSGAMHTAPAVEVQRFKRYPAYKDSGVEWLGEIPAGWQALKLKRVCSFAYGDSLASDFRTDGEVEVYGSNGAVGTHDRANTLAPCLVIGRKGSFGKVNFSSSAVFAIDTTFFVDSRYTHCDLRWLYYTLANARLDSATKDSAIPGLDREDAYAKDLCLPPAREQPAIAAFLDRATERIDALVAKKERLIELLQEKRSALIARAVTKGLDSAVPMKHSGVEWLGQIPVHWSVKPFTKYVLEKSDYRGKTPGKVPSGVFLVTARNVRMGMIDYECSQEFVAQDEYDAIMRRGLPRKGDILFTTEAPLGNVALVDREDIALAQRIIRFRTNPKYFNSQFALFAMMSSWFQAQLLTLSTGSTAAGLKASKLPMLCLLTPPLTEQDAIVCFLERETLRIDALVVSVRDAIDRLKELRTALISAAVTGKIDVQGEVA